MYFTVLPSFSIQSCPGLEQYAIKKFADSLEVLPRALAENSGAKVWFGLLLSMLIKFSFVVIKASEVISNLRAAHQSGNKNSGFDVRGEGSNVADAVAAGILDLYLCKYWGIKLATNAAATALKIDEVSVYSAG